MDEMPTVRFKAVQKIPNNPTGKPTALKNGCISQANVKVAVPVIAHVDYTRPGATHR